MGQPSRLKTSLLCASVSLLVVCVLVNCLEFIITGKDPNNYSNMIRVRTFGHDSPITNQRVLEEDRSLGQGVAKASCQPNLEGATTRHGHAIKKNPNLVHIADPSFIKNKFQETFGNTSAHGLVLQR